MVIDKNVMVNIKLIIVYIKVEQVVINFVVVIVN